MTENQDGTFKLTNKELTSESGIKIIYEDFFLHPSVTPEGYVEENGQVIIDDLIENCKKSDINHKYLDGIENAGDKTLLLTRSTQRRRGKDDYDKNIQFKDVPVDFIALHVKIDENGIDKDLILIKCAGEYMYLDMTSDRSRLVTEKKFKDVCKDGSLFYNLRAKNGVRESLKKVAISTYHFSSLNL